MGNHNRPLIAGFLALGLLQAGTGRDPDEILKQATAKVRALTDHARAYTCVETVERTYYMPASRSRSPKACPAVLEERRNPTPEQELRPYSTDRLRLDVTLTKEDEIFSWAGASRFDASIDTVVQNGPIGSGAFGAALDMIFNSDVKEFHFEGEQALEGVDLMEYSFQVRDGDSHYNFKIRNGWAKSGYAGSIFVDPESGEVVRLRLETIEPPPSTNSCKTMTTLDFGGTPSGPTSLQLPTHVQQRFIYPNGLETENVTNFANCREYQGESTIAYDPPAASVTAGGKSAQVKPAKKIPQIDAGLPFMLELLEPIDTDTAAAGDVFHARLVQPLRDAKKKLLAPGGSVVEGRLRRVQDMLQPHQVYVVLAPTALWIGDERVPFAANRDWNPNPKRPPSQGTMILMPFRDEAPAGVFMFPEHRVMTPGFRSDWRTAKAPSK